MLKSKCIYYIQIPVLEMFLLASHASLVHAGVFDLCLENKCSIYMYCI